MKRFLVLLVSLALATVSLAQRRAVIERPLSGGPHLSQELPISDVSFAPGSTGDRPRIVAGDAHQALVVWSSGVVRVDDAGSPLDVVPLISGSASQRLHDAVWNGENYVVGMTRDTERGEMISLVGVGIDGHVGASIDIERASNYNVYLAMAWSGDELALVYSTMRNDSVNVLTALIVSRGVVIKRIPLGESADRMSRGRVVPSPDGYLVLWPHNYALIGLHGATVTNGSLPQRDLDAVWDGSSYMVAAADTRGVVVYPISRNGTRGGDILVHATAASSVLPSIAWNGSEYRIVWQEEHRDPRPYGLGTYDLAAARMAADRVVLGEGVLSTKIWVTDYRFVPPADADAVTAVGATFVATWDGGPPIPTNSREIYASNVDAVDRTDSPQLISHAAATQTLTAMVAMSNAVRAFWVESSGTRSASVDPSGRYGESRGVPGDGTPFVAWNGVDTVLAWRDASSIHAAFIDAAGDTVNDVTLVSTSNALDALDCDARDCAIVWTSADLKKHVQRFSGNGAPIDVPLDLPPGFISMSGRGDGHLLLMRWPAAAGGNRIIATIFEDGKLSDITDLGVDAQPYLITAASKPDGWLVIVQSRAFVLDANAAVVAQAELPRGIDRTSAAWDGTNWIVAWEDLYADVKAARIAPNGALLDVFSIAASPDAERAPIVRSLGAGRTAVAYSRATSNRLYGTASRVFVRWLTE